MSHVPSFLLSSSHRLSTLERKQRSLATVHLLARSCKAFPFSRICAIWNTALTLSLWQMLHHPREVADALNYRASRFCWNSATREGNALILAKSQLQVWESLSSHSLCRSGVPHSACSYLPEMTDSQYIWRNWGIIKAKCQTSNMCWSASMKVSQGSGYIHKYPAASEKIRPVIW